MGWDITTRVELDGVATTCRAQLEGHEIILRGALKKKFAFASMGSLAARQGTLAFKCEGSRVRIELGERAAAWLDAIQNPRTRIQKLGIVPGQRVVVLGPGEPDAIEEIEGVLGAAPARRLTRAADVVLLFTRGPEELERLGAIEPALAPKGCVWVLWPKGTSAYKHEDVVRGARAAGLTQTRSMGFSAIYTGLRLVRTATKKAVACGGR